MGLILRVDVDKPYGRKTILQKVTSKLREDYWFPAISCLGYLKPAESLIEYCNLNGIQGVFYFRNCTLPDKKILSLLKEGNHQIGFHAENTRSLNAFNDELERFRTRLSGTEISSFTKHGSGDIKLGKNHYAPYEPELYKKWSVESGLRYFLGNEIIGSPDDISTDKDFYPTMFWIHNEYRMETFNKLEDVIHYAKTLDIPIIIHPANFIANNFVNSEFKKLVSMAKDASISWKLIS